MRELIFNAQKISDKCIAILINNNKQVMEGMIVQYDQYGVIKEYLSQQKIIRLCCVELYSIPFHMSIIYCFTSKFNPL